MKVATHDRLAQRLFPHTQFSKQTEKLAICLNLGDSVTDDKPYLSINGVDDAAEQRIMNDRGNNKDTIFCESSTLELLDKNDSAALSRSVCVDVEGYDVREDLIPAGEETIYEKFADADIDVGKPDYGRLRGIADRLVESAPSAMEDIVCARYYNHLEAVIRGLVQYKYLLGERDELVIYERDYVEVEEMFESIVDGWK